mmetsp:Transcript_86395/g.143144  ORF Transcript_86395/g.143144 Transcript_86395/m.143144 type:complete len:83 (-) Transcript_86395:635-883(-)
MAETANHDLNPDTTLTLGSGAPSNGDSWPQQLKPSLFITFDDLPTFANVIVFLARSIFFVSATPKPSLEEKKTRSLKFQAAP